jgi:20S proteasome subunit alpha 6
MSILKYDADNTTWSPQGKLLQIEYAMEAVKQGSICVALRGDNGAVLLSVKKNPTKLATYQEKIFKISKTSGVGISGMTADARMLCKYMRNVNTQNQVQYSSTMDISTLARKVAKKYQGKTNVSGKRPFGVGLLLTGLTSTGETRVIELNPNGDCLQYEAYAIGAKSQSARTYLEKQLKQFQKAELNKLVLHGLSAIKSGYRDEKEEMTENNIEISVLSKQGGFNNLNTNEVKDYLQKLNDFKPDNEMVIE